MFTLKYEFLGREEYIEHLPHPVPAQKAIPDWYKKLPRSRDHDTLEPQKETAWADPEAGGLVAGSTMKQCIPIRDYLTSGYIVPLWCEIAVSMEDGVPSFGWINSSVADIHLHFPHQYYDTPIADYDSTKHAVPKLASPWGFKTPKGYSSLFFSPWYYKGVIEILPAIVDTDVHHEVNFPFIYHGKNGERHTLERGSPIVQVIPFKREEWKSTVTVGDFEQNHEYRSFVSQAYRKLRHKKKVYR